MNNLFNNKILTEKAKNEIDMQSEEFITKREIINRYIDLYDSGVLMQTKEETLQGQFLLAIFDNILGAREKTNAEIGEDGTAYWNLEAEKKTLNDGQKPDGVLGFMSYNKENKQEKTDIRAVIELKGASINLDTRQKRTGDFRTAVEHAFAYAPKFGSSCQWIIS